MEGCAGCARLHRSCAWRASGRGRGFAEGIRAWYAKPRHHARAAQAALGGCGDPAVSTVVVFDAGDPERLDRPCVCLWLCVRSGRALRYPLGRSLWRRHVGRQARDAGGDHWRLGATLWTARHQRAHRRRAVPHPAWHAVLSRLRRATATCDLPHRQDRRCRIRGGLRGIGAAAGCAWNDRALAVSQAEWRRLSHSGVGIARRACARRDGFRHPSRLAVGVFPVVVGMDQGRFHGLLGQSHAQTLQGVTPPDMPCGCPGCPAGWRRCPRAPPCRSRARSRDRRLAAPCWRSARPGTPSRPRRGWSG